ncbi:uncharacterized protein BKA55DRAFT_584437 [Fusarium redolens]|uniref:Uncharacterized protein n=1 Tax=Fusarium redolens TaxID=48865 RepID=A0A9P9FZC8_FUSRE|nr:uncharacterized protein BKA55DRAFT_584437 [Fusarium redolens]KAH7224314.1 hypothetical protein BKA55DRAFT_584437 [Fusarium redolens]
MCPLLHFRPTLYGMHSLYTVRTISRRRMGSVSTRMMGREMPVRFGVVTRGMFVKNIPGD